MKTRKLLIAAKRITMTILLLFTGLSISLFVYLALISPGKPDVYRDDKGNILEGSISEKIFIPVGGVRQGMFIKSRNINNPVLLYLHGGPGFPNYFLIDKFKPGLEDFFTVCYWEQRGGGLSYTSEVTVESMTIDNLASDTIEVTNYLRNRFKKDKIYLFAHSGGTQIALPVLSKEPLLYEAYFAMAQITNQSESEKIAYKYIMGEYLKKGDYKSVKSLEKFNNLETTSDVLEFFNSGIRDKAMHESGIGTMRNMKSVFQDIFIPVWTCRAYTLKEKAAIWKSKLLFLPKTNLRSESLATDFPNTFPEINVPVYFFSGKYDLTVNVDLSRDYFNLLNAPVKGFYLFDNSAHSPLFEEPEKFMEILGKITILN